jgi:glycerol uptake facilitator-like aquaporin
MGDGDRTPYYYPKQRLGVHECSKVPESLHIDRCNQEPESRSIGLGCNGSKLHLLLVALREGIAAYFYGVTVYAAEANYAGWVRCAVAGLAYFGFSVLFGGASVNPVMALALLLSRNCTFKEFIVSIVSQFGLGYILAVVTIEYGLGIDASVLVPVVITGSIAVGFVAEFLGTMICCMCVAAASSGEAWEARAALTGVALAVAGIAFYGASRSCFNIWYALAASVFSFFDALAWIYYAAPIAGCVAAVVLVYILGLQKYCARLHCVSSCHAALREEKSDTHESC